MDWTIATMPVECGLCGVRMLKGTRMALVAQGRFVRCERCAEQLGNIIETVTAEVRTLLDDDLPLVDVADRPICPNCGRIMSQRESREQGACDDCRPDFDHPSEAS